MRGMVSEVAGMRSDIMRRNTQSDKRTVIPKEIFSPVSGGRQNTKRATAVMRAHGITRLKKQYNSCLYKNKLYKCFQFQLLQDSHLISRTQHHTTTIVMYYLKNKFECDIRVRHRPARKIHNISLYWYTQQIPFTRINEEQTVAFCGTVGYVKLIPLI